MSYNKAILFEFKDSVVVLVEVLESLKQFLLLVLLLLLPHLNA